MGEVLDIYNVGSYIWSLYQSNDLNVKHLKYNDEVAFYYVLGNHTKEYYPKIFQYLVKTL